MNDKNPKTDPTENLPRSLPRAVDRNGVPFTTGAIVRNIKTGEEFLVRGMYSQDEGPSVVSFGDEVEVVSQRPETMNEVVGRIDQSRDRGHGRERGAIRQGSGQADGFYIVWGW
jgi:hypothetical protein